MHKGNARYRLRADNGQFLFGSFLFFRAGNKAVKITLVQAILYHPILLKLALSKSLSDCGSNLSLVLQNIRIVELQERIQLGSPIHHCHRYMPSGLSGGIVEIHGHDFIQFLHLTFGKIVLGNGNIRFYDLPSGSIFPCGQPHMFFCMVCSCHDHFCSRVSMNSIMHLVLYRGEEILCDLTVNSIINRRGVNIRDLLIEAALACTDLLNLGNQVVKIILIENLTVYKTVLIQHITLFCKGVQHLGRPLAELCGTAGIDAIPYGDNCRERIELIAIGLSVIRNLCKICTSSIFIKFSASNTMAWIGYLLREWSYRYDAFTSSIVKTVGLSYLSDVYLPYHSLDILKAIEKIAEEKKIDLDEDPQERLRKILEKTYKLEGLQDVPPQ